MGNIPAQYDQDFLDCRDLLHAWDATSATITQPDKNHLARQITCLRCGTIKHQLLDIKSFELVSTKYETPQGYRLPRGVRKTDVRKTVISRQLRTSKQAKRVAK